MDNNEALKFLDNFLVNNVELEELSARLSTFNIFNVLRIENKEIRHSNALAWLIDPQESHGLGQIFLRRFLSTILLDNENVDISLTPAQVPAGRNFPFVTFPCIDTDAPALPFI